METSEHFGLLEAELARQEEKLRQLRKQSRSLGLYPYILEHRKKPFAVILWHCVRERFFPLCMFCVSLLFLALLSRWLRLWDPEEPSLMITMCAVLLAAAGAVCAGGILYNLWLICRLALQDQRLDREIVARYQKNLVENEARLAAERVEKRAVDEQVAALARTREAALRLYESGAAPAALPYGAPLDDVAAYVRVWDGALASANYFPAGNEIRPE